METLKTPSENSVDFNRGFQGFSMANLETGVTFHLSFFFIMSLYGSKWPQGCKISK